MDNNGWIGEPAGGVAHGDGSLVGGEKTQIHKEHKHLRNTKKHKKKETQENTRSNWLNCALRDDEAVYWVSIGHYKAVAVGN